jgi:hypothetical protein
MRFYLVTLAPTIVVLLLLLFVYNNTSIRWRIKR